MEDICAECRNNCCEGYTVYINGFDLYRIVEKTSLDPAQFVTLYEGLDGEGTGYYFTLGEDRWLQLSLTGHNSEACVFYRKENGVGRCGIHLFRPNVCRGYPFNIRNNRLFYMDEVLCPRKWTISKRESRVFSTAIEHMNSDYRHYFAILERWNRVVQAHPSKEQVRPAEFFRYLFSAIEKDYMPH